MKLVVQRKLLPSPEQAESLEATSRACNRAADHVSRIAFGTGGTDRNGLQELVYTDIKAAFGLSAQPAVRVVKKVVDAYGALAASLKAGRLGGPGTKRYRKSVGSPVTFRPEAAQPFDDRCLSWQTDARMVSIWTVDGRMRGIRYRFDAYDNGLIHSWQTIGNNLQNRLNNPHVRPTPNIGRYHFDTLRAITGILRLALRQGGK